MNAVTQAGYPVNMLLSGGYDSRLALLMALAGSPGKENLRVTSYESRPNDFQVASSICKRLGLSLNAPGPRKHRTLSNSDALRTYFLSCGATYLPMYPVNSHFIQSETEIRVTGDQPTSWDFFLGSGPFNGSREKIRQEIDQTLVSRVPGQSVGVKFSSVFQDLDIETGHPGAMLSYYCATRSRHHCGRNWYRSLGTEYLMTPLTQKSFTALGFHNLSSGDSPKKIFADAFSAFGGWALEEDFEKPHHVFEPELLDNSPFRGGAEIRPRRYQVFGHLQNFKLPEPDIFSMDLDFNFKPENIKDDLAHLFYAADAARASGLFIKQDLDRAKTEIRASGSLSHNHRTLCHIISTDMVLRIVAKSRNNYLGGRSAGKPVSSDSRPLL